MSLNLVKGCRGNSGLVKCVMMNEGRKDEHDDIHTL